VDPLYPQTESYRPETPSRSDLSRERLIRAAEKLFAEKGYEGTTVKDLTEEAGVNVSMVSYHFGGKEGLYRSCLQSFGGEALKMAQRILQPPQTEEELRVRLTLFVTEVLLYHLAHSELSQIVMRATEMDNPIAQDVFRETFLKSFGALVDFFTVAQSKGFFAADLDPQIVGGLVMGGLLQNLRSRKIAERHYGVSLAHDPVYRTKVIEHIITLSMKGCIR
jgi:AcrR family transcriptional regulator